MEKNRKPDTGVGNGEQKSCAFCLWIDWIRVILGIVILCVLLGVSLSMINGKFTEKADELIEDDKQDFAWVVTMVGYGLPLILTAAVPPIMCVACKKDEQRKYLIKGLIVAGAAIVILGIVCPKQITDGFKHREVCLALEQKADEEEDFIYPENEPSVKEVTAELERVVRWTAVASLGIAVAGVYQGARYKKLRDGEEDDEIPEDELSDDLPDVDWVPGNKESKNS